MQSTQSFFAELSNTLLTPAKFIFTGIQGAASWAVNSMTTSHVENESIASLHETINQLNDQLDQRNRQIQLDQEKFDELRALAPQGLRADQLLAATITGYQAGPSASLITLDKGSNDKIQRGMIVTACSSVSITNPVTQSLAKALVPQASIIGLVDTVTLQSCTVRLLSDPRMKTQAILVRRLPEGSATLTQSPCLLEGLGDNKLRCNTINVDDLTNQPQLGDLAELADQNYPANVRYMVIGQITNVARKDTQLLRYDLTITPKINLTGSQSVLIIIKN